jgi:hypothetical protein
MLPACDFPNSPVLSDTVFTIGEHLFRPRVKKGAEEILRTSALANLASGSSKVQIAPPSIAERRQCANYRRTPTSGQGDKPGIVEQKGFTSNGA